MSDDGIKFIQRQEARLLAAFDGVCRANGLRYFLCGGTLLGAVRHHGFIPWDDDADVVMLREDYQRLEQILIAGPPEGMYWESVSNPDHFPTNHFFGKLCLADTDIVDATTPAGGVVHHFGLDVYPLDRRPASSLLRLRQRFLSYYYTHLSSLLFGGSSSRYGGLKKVLKALLSPFHRSAAGLADAFRDVASIGERHAHDGLVSLCGGYGYRRETFREEWFADTVEMDFEDMKLPAAVGWREMLLLAYGPDYMTPPPECEHRSHYRVEGAPL